MKILLYNLKKGLLICLTLMLICGVVFPLAVTGASNLLFSSKAKGSMVTVDGKEVGSKVIGQAFTDEKYFVGRVSAVNYNTYKEGDPNYKGVATGGFNQAQSNPELMKRINKDIDEFLKKNPDVKKKDIPADLITASASGLDPDISVEVAKIQVPRIAAATGKTEADIMKIIEKNTKQKVLGVFGEETVNVLGANIDIYKGLSQ
ncbi:potassium-transporting ATPase subunit KdpC [Clostridium sp.]|uniref:potassium-transporting ATPase subunit KdpC n=1 Tax=Clostridium sp. TaxID=1506 RepID=UPI002FC9D4F6